MERVRIRYGPKISVHGQSGIPVLILAVVDLSVVGAILGEFLADLFLVALDYVRIDANGGHVYYSVHSLVLLNDQFPRRNAYKVTNADQLFDFQRAII